MLVLIIIMKNKLENLLTLRKILKNPVVILKMLMQKQVFILKIQFMVLEKIRAPTRYKGVL